MTIQEVGICFTAIISLLSLVLSVANFWKSKPKLRIEIMDRKWDAFFGKVRPLNTFSYISGIKFSIVNNSPVSITISDIKMIIQNETLRLINNKNDVWHSVEFYFQDDNGDLISDGCGIDYAEHGFSVPFKLNAYDAITGYALFHYFPAQIQKKCKGTLVLGTAIGKIKKNIHLVEYDKNYIEEDYRDYLQYCRSLGEAE